MHCSRVTAIYFREILNGTPCTKMHKRLLFTVFFFSNKYKGSKKGKCTMIKCDKFFYFLDLSLF